MLHRSFEQLIVQAYLDPAFASALLADPRRAAYAAGYSVLEAEALVGLPSASLEAFASGLVRRLYPDKALPRGGTAAPSAALRAWG